jgi:phosphatidylglycerol:prolipoprotein diacylglycerol transferase
MKYAVTKQPTFATNITFDNMYPDLSYLFHDLLGTAPDNWLSIFKTFGFFLAVAFIVSALVYHLELKRKAEEGFFTATTVRIVEGQPASISDILINAAAGFFFVGKGVYAYLHFPQFRQDPASIILSGKFHWISAILGGIVFAGLIWWDARRKQTNPPTERFVKFYPHDRISEMTVWAAVGGILGAKVFDLFDNWQSFLADPLGALLSGGGLAFFGGLIFGFIAVVWYQSTLKIPFLPSADAVAPALTMGYGVGRIGCQVSGDGDWGIVNTAPKPDWMSFLPDWMWGYQYPHNVLNTVNTDPVPSVPIEGCTWEYCMQLGQPVYPTPFYETMMMMVVFAILWALRKRINIPGMIFFIYLALISIERFMIEKIRVNVQHDGFMRLTQAELISVGFVLISVVGMVFVWNRHKKTATV